MLAVADAFDAMTNNRPYRKAMEIDAAVAELKRNVNRQFDEEIVDYFTSTLHPGLTVAPRGILPDTGQLV
jgi:HD-GYP domain-containing protein (c-di-GMP phosphodiesterase class II)